MHHDDLDIVEKAIRLLLLFQQSKGSSDVIAEMDIGEKHIYFSQCYFVHLSKVRFHSLPHCVWPCFQISMAGLD